MFKEFVVYTEEELRAMGNIISSLEEYWAGYIVRRVSRTVNYYRLTSDGLWENYDCRTA